MHGAAGFNVQVQVCGRREPVSVAHMGVAELAETVEQHFGVRPPFLFTDHGGRALPDDEALAECVGHGETIVVKLAGGVLHDFGRRVDQIRHLQWGLLTDRLATFQQSAQAQEDNARQLGMELQRERDLREAGHKELQGTINTVQDLIRKESLARDAAIQTLADQIAQLRLPYGDAVRTSGPPGDGEHLDLQKLFLAEAASRETLAQNLRRELAESRATVELTQVAWQEELRTLRQQLAVVIDVPRAGQQPDGAFLRTETAVQMSLQQAIDNVRSSLALEQASKKEFEARLDKVQAAGQDQKGEIKGLMSQFQELRTLCGSIKGEFATALEGLHERDSVHPEAVTAASLARLRDDCREALQREVRLRKDHDAALQEAVDQLRRHLESHTHEVGARTR